MRSWRSRRSPTRCMERPSCSYQSAADPHWASESPPDAAGDDAPPNQQDAPDSTSLDLLVFPLFHQEVKLKPAGKAASAPAFGPSVHSSSSSHIFRKKNKQTNKQTCFLKGNKTNLVPLKYVSDEPEETAFDSEPKLNVIEIPPSHQDPTCCRSRRK